VGLVECIGQPQHPKQGHQFRPLLDAESYKRGVGRGRQSAAMMTDHGSDADHVFPGPTNWGLQFADHAITALLVPAIMSVRGFVSPYLV
jgi:hypothetical protein